MFNISKKYAYVYLRKTIKERFTNENHFNLKEVLNVTLKSTACLNHMVVVYADCVDHKFCFHRKLVIRELLPVLLSRKLRT